MQLREGKGQQTGAAGSSSPGDDWWVPETPGLLLLAAATARSCEALTVGNQGRFPKAVYPGGWEQFQKGKEEGDICGERRELC